MSLRSAVHRLGLGYASWLCGKEQRAQVFVRLNERPVEYAFLLRQVARLQPPSILDVGTGQTALPHLLRSCGAVVTAIDNVRDFWPGGLVNRHWRVIDDDIRASRLSQRFHLVVCVSVLEHIPDHEAAVAGMLRLLLPGGHVVLTVPYCERSYCENVYALPGSEAQGRPLPAYRTQSFSRRELDGWLGMGARLVEQEHWQFYEGEHWTVGPRLAAPRRVTAADPHQLTCLLLARA